MSVFGKGRRSSNWAPLIILAGLFGGCASQESIAPRVVGRPLLEEGRVIYTTRCTDCHNAVAVTAHSRAEWPEIIRRMAPESRLTAKEENAVLQYVMAFAP